MKVLLFNGSSNTHGCTYTALEEIASALQNNGIETEIIQIGKDAIRDCIGCGACRKIGGKCVFKDDIVNEVIEKAKTAEDLFSVHLFIMHIRAEDYYRLWTEFFTQAGLTLHLNLRQL